MYSKNDIRHYFGPVHPMPMPLQRQPQHEDSLPANFFPGRPPGFIPPAYSPPYLLFDFATVTASNALIPSQVKFSKLKGATGNNSSDDVLVADKKVGHPNVSGGNSTDVSVLADTNVRDGNYTASVLADGVASDDDVSEDYILADMIVRDAIYTGFGLGNSFVSFTATPEEEIIFESQDSVDSAFAAVLYYHAFPPCVYIRCRRSSLRWVTALIYKLLLIAWDLWQYKTRH